MIKVLLVDDNRYALEYFSRIIPWEKYGYEIVGTALDGEFAYAQFLTHAPQVVITDIQMPNINGIELAAKIFQKAPNTIILFLSSYEEFKYAQSALQMGIYDYILKHEVTEEKLSGKLISIKNIIQENTRNHYYIDEGNLLYLLNDTNTDSLTSEQSQNISGNYQGLYHLCILVQDSIFPELEKYSSSEKDITENDMKQFLYQYPEIIAAVRTSKFTYVLLLEGNSSFYDIVNVITNQFRIEFPATVSMILAAEKSVIRNCFHNYKAIQKNLGLKYFFLPSSVLYKDIFLTPQTVAEQIRTEEFFNLAKKSDYSGIFQLLSKKFRTVILKKDIAAFQSLVRISADILDSCRQTILNPQTQTLYEISEADSEMYWYDASSISHWLAKQFEALGKMQHNNMNNIYSKPVNDVILYIHQRYQDSDLSVESIADYFDMNMNQLNYMIKKEVGETVIKLITKTRMQKAKLLLSDKNLSVSDISLQTGYKSVSYFSNVFKKYFKESPQDYRRKNS